MVLHLPVTAVELWRGVLPVLVRTLTFLTGDMWDIQLRSGEVPTAPTGKSKLKKVETVCLFSGGLDSLIGAIDMLEEGRVVALVGHYGAGLTGSIQRDVLLALTKRYGSAAIPVRFYVQPAKRKREGEPTMRSRSFLFLALAVAVMDAIGGAVPLTIAENGLISLNVPLTRAYGESEYPHDAPSFCWTLFQSPRSNWIAQRDSLSISLPNKRRDAARNKEF